jgi:hypothetical protein
MILIRHVWCFIELRHCSGILYVIICKVLKGIQEYKALLVLQVPLAPLVLPELMVWMVLLVHKAQSVLLALPVPLVQMVWTELLVLKVQSALLVLLALLVLMVWTELLALKVLLVLLAPLEQMV